MNTVHSTLALRLQHFFGDLSYDFIVTNLLGNYNRMKGIGFKPFLISSHLAAVCNQWPTWKRFGTLVACPFCRRDNDGLVHALTCSRVIPAVFKALGISSNMPSLYQLITLDGCDKDEADIAMLVSFIVRRLVLKAKHFPSTPLSFIKCLVKFLANHCRESRKLVRSIAGQQFFFPHFLTEFSSSHL